MTELKIQTVWTSGFSSVFFCVLLIFIVTKCSKSNLLPIATETTTDPVITITILDRKNFTYQIIFFHTHKICRKCIPKCLCSHQLFGCRNVQKASTNDNGCIFSTFLKHIFKTYAILPD